MRDAFSQYHPVIQLFFYIGAILFGMIFLHPLYLGCSLLLSFAYYLLLAKQKIKYVLGMFGLFLLLSVLNPLFNTAGERILFTYLGGRHYTFEALCYGMALAAMFITVITWFASYNLVMTSDKFLYCFGRILPAASMILTMVFRLVPSYQKQLKKIAEARKCIGKSSENGSVLRRAEHGMENVSALVSFAFECGIVTADSMRSRGFRSGKRTAFSIYRWENRDRGLLFFMLLLICGIICCVVKGGTLEAYTPEIVVAGKDNGYTWLGILLYGIFLGIPTGIHLTEEWKWHILKSKI